ncbi:uncharacterized protein [Palaemon carinicauda]|uniref:uncharacterized protein isoform X2 n=1 Tax=Palaemon carinicauda TaxID=392227 RepID=UPI0035B5DBB5
MKPKFQRRNFTEEEKVLLFVLAEKDKEIIEKRGIGGPAVREKRKVWDKIALIFNAQKHIVKIQRSAKDLRKCWFNQRYRDQLNSHATYLENHASPTLVNVEVDPALIDPSPEPVQDAWEGDHTAKNGNDKVQIQISKPEAVTVKSPPNQQPSKPQSSAAASRVPPENNAASVKLETAASSDSVWPVSLRPYQKRKLDSILEQDQKLINSQLTLSKIEEEKNLLQLKILNGQLKNVQKEADLLDKKILLTDRKIQYWDRLLKNGSGHHVFPNV